MNEPKNRFYTRTCSLAFKDSESTMTVTIDVKEELAQDFNACNDLMRRMFLLFAQNLLKDVENTLDFVFDSNSEKKSQ